MDDLDFPHKRPRREQELNELPVIPPESSQLIPPEASHPPDFSDSASFDVTGSQHVSADSSAFYQNYPHSMAHMAHAWDPHNGAAAAEGTNAYQPYYGPDGSHPNFPVSMGNYHYANPPLAMMNMYHGKMPADTRQGNAVKHVANNFLYKLEQCVESIGGKENLNEQLKDATMLCLGTEETGGDVRRPLSGGDSIPKTATLSSFQQQISASQNTIKNQQNRLGPTPPALHAYDPTLDANYFQDPQNDSMISPLQTTAPPINTSRSASTSPHLPSSQTLPNPNQMYKSPTWSPSSQSAYQTATNVYNPDVTTYIKSEDLTQPTQQSTSSADVCGMNSSYIKSESFGEDTKDIFNHDRRQIPDTSGTPVPLRYNSPSITQSEMITQSNTGGSSYQTVNTGHREMTAPPVSCVSPSSDLGAQSLVNSYQSDCPDMASRVHTQSLIGGPADYRSPCSSIADRYLAIELALCRSLGEMSFPPVVTHIYNPLEHAIQPHTTFVKRYCTGTKQVLFLGMNPGPYGMSQTGVPFGEVSLTRDWLGISGHVTKPLREHPKRPVLGFDCPRNEVSGARFWGLMKKLCQTPDIFFRHCFVHNLCPLLFLSESGKNVPPPDFPAAAKRQLEAACGAALREVVQLLNPHLVVGIGKFAQDKAMNALQGMEVKVTSVMHPSPANPAANRGWEPVAEAQLTEMGIMHYLLPQP